MNHVGRKPSKDFEMTWLEDRIYILFHELKGNDRVRVFSAEAPFQETSEPIEMRGLGCAYEMRASAVSRSIFITDFINYGLWKIQMPGNVVTHWKIDGEPSFKSISAADEVVVLVRLIDLTWNYNGIHHDSFSLNIYRAADVTLSRIVDISAEITDISRFVISPNGTFIFIYNNPSLSSIDIISELSADGRNILRTFDIGSFKSIKTKCWLPEDLAVVDDGRIFVADNFKHRLFLLNQQMTDYQLLIDHSVVEPFRLYYIPHKQQLIVGEMNHYEPRVSILHLSPCEAIKRTRVG